MPTLQEMRAQLSESTTTKSELDMEAIHTKVKEAYQTLSGNIGTVRKIANYVQIQIGNLNSPHSQLEAVVQGYNESIAKQGYKGQMYAKLDSFSNLGDPFYMGDPNDVVTYYVRIYEV